MTGSFYLVESDEQKLVYANELWAQYWHAEATRGGKGAVTRALDAFIYTMTHTGRGFVCGYRPEVKPFAGEDKLERLENAMVAAA